MCGRAVFIWFIHGMARSLHPHPAPGLGPAPTWSEDNNCLLLRLPPRPAQTTLDGAGLQTDDSNTV